jgi:hypothetical protein
MVRRNEPVTRYWYEYALSSGARTIADVRQRFTEDYLRSKRHERDAAPAASADLQRAEQPGPAQTADICRWVRVDHIRWAITGPESVLRRGVVVVKANRKDPEEVRVTNVRPWRGLWIADKVKRREAKQLPAVEPQAVMDSDPTPTVPASSTARGGPEIHEALLYLDWL